MLDAAEDLTGVRNDYYHAHEALTATEVRRIWTAEGKRRGYVLEDA